MFFFLTLFVQNVLGFSPIQAGLAFLPVTAGDHHLLPVRRPLPAQARPQAPDGRRRPARRRRPGLADPGLGDQRLRRRACSARCCVFGLGMGLKFVPLTLIAVSGVAPHEAGAASGLLNATQQVGGSLGLSILVTVFGTASRNEAATQVAAVPAHRPARRPGPVPADRPAPRPLGRPDPRPWHLHLVPARGRVRRPGPGGGAVRDPPPPQAGARGRGGARRPASGRRPLLDRPSMRRRAPRR